MVVVYFSTTRLILPGEEIFWYYGDEFPTDGLVVMSQEPSRGSDLEEEEMKQKDKTPAEGERKLEEALDLRHQRRSNRHVDYAQRTLSMFTYSATLEALFKKVRENKGSTFPHMGCTIEILSVEPVIIVLHGFLKPYLTKLTKAAEAAKWHRSPTQNSEGQQQVDPSRTSQTCVVMGDNKLLQDINAKVAELTGMAADKIEPLQMVKYQPSEYFNLHHDAGTLVGDLEDADMRVDPPVIEAGASTTPAIRVLTLFGYVTSSDAGTHFPVVNVTSQAIAGNAVLFANVDTKKRCLDTRSSHLGQTVKDGEKLGLNIWVTRTHNNGLIIVRRSVTKHSPIRAFELD
jgi:hypothetical protein